MISVSVSDLMQGTVLNVKSFLFLNLSESPKNTILLFILSLAHRDSFRISDDHIVDDEILKSFVILCRNIWMCFPGEWQTSVHLLEKLFKLLTLYRTVTLLLTVNLISGTMLFFLLVCSYYLLFLQPFVTSIPTFLETCLKSMPQFKHLFNCE